jgi:hypothetical protein
VVGDGTLHDQMAVGHLSADGVVDTNFGPNGTGMSYAQVGPNTFGWSVAIDPLRAHRGSANLLRLQGTSPSQLVQRTEVIFLPGSPRRGLSCQSHCPV